MGNLIAILVQDCYIYTYPIQLTARRPGHVLYKASVLLGSIYTNAGDQLNDRYRTVK